MAGMHKRLYEVSLVYTPKNNKPVPLVIIVFISLVAQYPFGCYIFSMLFDHKISLLYYLGRNTYNFNKGFDPFRARARADSCILKHIYGKNIILWKHHVSLCKHTRNLYTQYILTRIF